VAYEESGKSPVLLWGIFFLGAKWAQVEEEIEREGKAAFAVRFPYARAFTLGMPKPRWLNQMLNKSA